MFSLMIGATPSKAQVIAQSENEGELLARMHEMNTRQDEVIARAKTAHQIAQRRRTFMVTNFSRGQV
jgi:hypothetical protein